jgi:hypothetical protein
MKAPLLFQHGQHIKPHYAPISGSTRGRAGKSTANDRPDRKLSGVVTRFDKHQRVNTNPIAMGLIDAVWKDAIRYTSRQIGLSGLPMIAGVLGFIGMCFGSHMMSSIYSERLHSIFDLVFYVFPPFFFMFGLWFLLFAIRIELFRPIDEPTIFDRKHRKVYRVFSETQPGIKGLFKPWPLVACEYDWDLIDVEHIATVTAGASTVSRKHALMFIVRKSADDPTIIDSFNIGNSLILGDQTTPAMWEHIRRFMEENGPALPGMEGVLKPEPELGLWERLRRISPFSMEYWRYWRAELPLMLFAHIMFPFMIMWVFFRWLSDRTAVPIEWPKEVIDAVGPEISEPPV